MMSGHETHSAEAGEGKCTALLLTSLTKLPVRGKTNTGMTRCCHFTNCKVNKRYFLVFCTLVRMRVIIVHEETGHQLG